MIIAITQGRMTSSRLPGKVLKPILGHPMAWHQLQRTKQAKQLDKSIFATSTEKSDDVLAEFFIQCNEPIYRGSLNNVLSRYYHCAKEYNPTHVIRLTADCPLIDPLLIDQVIQQHLTDNNDYTGIANYPIGLSVEMMKFSVLEAAYYEAQLRSEREHVTPFIGKHPERFKIGRVTYKENLSHLRWTVDYEEDFILVSRIYETLYPDNPEFRMSDVLSVLDKHPDWTKLNAHFDPREGIKKSVAQDGEMNYFDD